VLVVRVGGRGGGDRSEAVALLGLGIGFLGERSVVGAFEAGVG
jgi:hypothetical protein